MKVASVLLFITLLTKVSSAQNDLFKCAEKNFLHMDTVLKQGKNPWNEWHDCVIGKQMPDFSVTTISGQKIEAEKLRGKILVINLWFIDCHPCIAELPALNKLVDAYRDKNVVFLAMTYETLKRLNVDFFPKYKFDFSLLSDADAVIDMFGGSGYPTTYIIDKKGKIKEAWIGGPIDEKAETEAYLKAKPIIDELLKAE
ncbi:MAG: TlpA disulfide reductase family protein [Bacteroidota bacterium]